VFQSLVLNPEWKDKTAVVTGSSSGIGLETAVLLAKSGMKVVAAARRLEKIEEELALREIPQSRIRAVRADLTQESDIESIFKVARDEFGPVAVLINNAGVGFESSLIDGDPLLWKQMLEVNVMGLSLATRFAMDDMIKNDHGHVIHMSSMSAYRVAPGSAMYAATKFAVRALAEGLRQELSAKKSKVRITAISPGWVETEFATHYYHHLPEKKANEVYDELKALQPIDIVSAIIHALNAPEHVGINDILMRPIEQFS
jgi:NADP-dependent 3-hydroxy acid dehydrogenase YdfG